METKTLHITYEFSSFVCLVLYMQSAKKKKTLALTQYACDVGQCVCTRGCMCMHAWIYISVYTHIYTYIHVPHAYAYT